MKYKEFKTNFGTDKQCMEYLFNLRWDNGYRCPRCNHNEMWQIKDFKYKCKKCSYQTTVLSGTLFQDSHIPISRWFEAIWYITSSGEKVTSTKLQKQLGLGSNRSVLLMMNKIKHARFSEKEVKLQGVVELYRDFVYDDNRQPLYLIIAVEIKNKAIGRIKLRRIDSRDYTKTNQFIETYIERGSTLLCWNWRGIEDARAKGYICKVKPDRYAFSCCKKIELKFNNWLRENYSEKMKVSYNIFACDVFCKEFNKSKNTPSFEEVLNNAVHLPPMPNINK